METEYNFTPLLSPIPISEQIWPEGTIPLVCTSTLAYNHEPYIKECIDGILLQKTTFPVQVLIHEDCSTDNTAEILKEYQSKYPKLIKVFYQPENIYNLSGKEILQKRVVFNSWRIGKYIALCEGDDFWIDQLKLQKQVNILEVNDDYGLVFSDVNFFFESEGKTVNKVFQTNFLPLFSSFEEHLENAGYFAPCTWLIRQHILPKIDFHVTDMTFVIMLDIMLKSKIYFLQEVTAVYRSRQGSASKQKDINNRYKYLKGIFEIKVYFCTNRSSNIKLENKIRKKGYIDLFYIAFYNKDWLFIKDALLFFYKNRFINNQNEYSKAQIFYFYFIGLIKMTRYLFVGFCKISTRRILILLKFNNNTIAKVDKMFRRFLK